MATIEPHAITLAGDEAWPMPVVSLVDRRTSRQRRARFVFSRSLEAILWGLKEKSNGTLFQLLQRHSLEAVVYTVDKGAVEREWLTQAEFDAILGAFREACVVDVEARRRVRQCSMIPLSAAVTACTSFGRNDQTVQILKIFKSLPRLWSMQMQSEADEVAGEVDLV